MSLDEYNHHARLGPMAGPPTNASQLAGQQAYDNAHRQLPQGGVYSTPSGPPGEIPKFLREGALRRGLWTMGIATVLSIVSGLLLRPGTNLSDGVIAVTAIAFIFGLFLTLCGVISKIAGLRKKPSITPASEATAAAAEHVDKR
ncbi:hypothetical protein [Hydrogenophaga laconesensis]|uniref:Uncharacterized protein n=1 Tax=Hydrogenophaga laconesensis TaxID=1805971 RepID=A0ABU1VD96_9BURK|nr:hypothetical protein [Hydrogenophaga laconesensis]MDR7095325.1 hypothetical protein [Hydrogenophaga laconesensis]